MSGAVLLTGGAGYIGSHTCLALIEAGFSPVLYDSFINAQDDVPERLAQAAGQSVPVIRGDVRDETRLQAVFRDHDIQAVLHFAALKSVFESVGAPLRYFRNNLGGLLSVLGAMEAHGCRTLVLSSSASVYGVPTESPTPETARRCAINPYGQTKITCEEMLEALPGDWHTGILRYFNPTGAHHSGLIGERPRYRVENLMPILAEVARGDRAELLVHGQDYPTPDGTPIRDYLHIEDLARGHVLSLQRLLETKSSHLVNLGTGHGYSVLEMIEAYARASGQDVPHRIVGRRPGDVPIYCARTERAAELLGFRTQKTLDEICASSWHWARQMT